MRRLLGFNLDDGATSTALRSLGFTVEDRGDAFAVTSPPYALEFKKAYGNAAKNAYVDWLRPFAESLPVPLT